MNNWKNEEDLYLNLIHKIVAEAFSQLDKVLINMCLDYCMLPIYKIRISFGCIGSSHWCLLLCNIVKCTMLVKHTNTADVQHN